ncbi:MAG: PIN domain-containing protein [Verrucomicrobiales bacterium]|nr:PIN domain-containing protein [Verrucomicrobiales bacterium]
MKTVFVDTSGFYALLDGTDPFHPTAKSLFQRAEREQWLLVTTNYVVHETWALVQHRLGWDALDDFLDVMLPLCRVEFADEALHASGVQRCRQARLRNLSLTDCISFECMKRSGITEAIANDAHFAREQFVLP